MDEHTQRMEGEVDADELMQGNCDANLNALINQVSQLQSGLASAASDLHEINRRRLALEMAEEAVAQQRWTLEEASTALDAERAQLRGAELELEESRKAFEEERTALAERHKALDDLRNDLDARDAQIAVLNMTFDARRAEFDDNAGRLKEKEAQLTERESALDMRRDQLKVEYTNLQDRRADLDLFAQNLSERERQIADSQSGLDELAANLDLRVDELREQQRRLDEQAEQLEPQRGDLNRQRVEIETRLEAIDHDHRKLGARVRQLDEQECLLAEDRDKLAERQVVLDGRGQELDRREEAIKRREQELEDAATAAATRLTAEELEEMRELRRKIESEQHHLVRQQAQVQKTFETIKQREQLIEAREREQDARSEAIDQELKEREGRALDAVRRRTAHLEEAEEAVRNRDTKLRSRLGRLKQAKRKLEAKRDELMEEINSFGNVRSQAREVLQQRKFVVENQQLLAQAEKHLVKRWAVRSSVGRVAAVAACVLFLFMGSMIAGDKLGTKIYSAQASVQLDLAAGDMDESEWLANQRDVVLHHEALAMALPMVRQAGHTDLGNWGELKSKIESNLVVDSPEDGWVIVRLRGSESQTLQPILHGVVAGYVKYLNKERAGLARLAVPAALSTMPIVDTSMAMSIQFFVIGAVVLAGLFGVAALLLMRTRRLITDAIDIDGIADDGTWARYQSDLTSDEYQADEEELVGEELSPTPIACEANALTESQVERVGDEDEEDRPRSPFLRAS